MYAVNVTSPAKLPNSEWLPKHGELSIDKPISKTYLICQNINKLCVTELEKPYKNVDRVHDPLY